VAEACKNHCCGLVGNKEGGVEGEETRKLAGEISGSHCGEYKNDSLLGYITV
jgi:hypothetical protein